MKDRWCDLPVEVKANLIVYDEVREYEDLELHKQLLQALGARILRI